MANHDLSRSATASNFTIAAIIAQGILFIPTAAIARDSYGNAGTSLRTLSTSSTDSSCAQLGSCQCDLGQPTSTNHAYTTCTLNGAAIEAVGAGALKPDGYTPVYSNQNQAYNSARLLANSQSSIAIDAFGVCRYLDNSSTSNSYFIPFRTAAEWNSFRTSGLGSMGISMRVCSRPMDNRTMPTFTAPASYAPDYSYPCSVTTYTAQQIPNTYATVGTVWQPPEANRNTTVFCHNYSAQVGVSIYWQAIGSANADYGTWTNESMNRFGPDLALSANSVTQPANPPGVTLDVGRGEDVTLKWTSATPNGVTVVAAEPDNLVISSTMPGSIVVNPLNTTNYQLSARNSDGLTTTATVQVIVHNPNLTLTADKGSTPTTPTLPSETVTLNWTMAWVNNCTASSSDGSWTGTIATTPPNGSKSVSPDHTTTYTLTCGTNDNNRTTASVTIYIPEITVGNAPETMIGENAEFPVRLNPAMAIPVTATYKAAGAGATADGTVTFPANSDTQTISVPTAYDSSFTTDQTLTLTLTNPANAGFAGGANSITAQGTVKLGGSGICAAGWSAAEFHDRVVGSGSVAANALGRCTSGYLGTSANSKGNTDVCYFGGWGNSHNLHSRRCLGATTATITASAPSIELGQPVTLSWSSSPTNVVESCTASVNTGGGSWSGAVSTGNSSAAVTPTAAGSYDYALSCKDTEDHTAVNQVTVEVRPASSYCGSDNGKTLEAPPTNLCVSSTASTLSPQCVEWAGNFGDCSKTRYRWTCQAGSTTDSCAAYLNGAPPLNGACGSAHGTSVSAAPANNLCTAGNESSVSGSGPWTWTCTGENKGTTANCSASKASCATPTFSRTTNGRFGGGKPATPYWNDLYSAVNAMLAGGEWSTDCNPNMVSAFNWFLGSGHGIWMDGCGKFGKTASFGTVSTYCRTEYDPESKQTDVRLRVTVN